ncbi:hypothetical protein B0H17DRAFT_1032420, partial [Mycena rosella]
MWEGRHGHGGWGARDGNVIWEGRERGREREPAMPATLSASSSRPWALAGGGSCASLASLGSECGVLEDEGDGEGGEVDGEGEGEGVLSLSSASASASASSDSLSFSSKACDMRLRKEASSGSSGVYTASASASPSASPSASEGEGEDAEEGDDERSERGVPGAECGPYSFKHGRTRSEYTQDEARHHGHGRGRAQSESSGATHGHGHGEYGAGYKGDGYGGDEEDAWVRARAVSLARLRARKEARRGGG